MFMRRSPKFVASTLCLALATGGCGLTVDQRNALANQVVGGLVGGGLGAALGAATGGGKGAAIGAAAGAIAGIGTVALLQYQARQTRSAAEESRILGYDASQGTVVRIQGADVGPDRVRSGQRVDLAMDYAVLAPNGTTKVAVSETWELWQNGALVTSVPRNEEHRRPGGWQARAAIVIPPSAAPGTYVIKHRIESGTVSDDRETSFVVVS